MLLLLLYIPQASELSIRVVQMLMAFSFHTHHMYTIGSFEKFDLAHQFSFGEFYLTLIFGIYFIVVPLVLYNSTDTI